MRRKQSPAAPGLLDGPRNHMLSTRQCLVSSFTSIVGRRLAARQAAVAAVEKRWRDDGSTITTTEDVWRLREEMEQYNYLRTRKAIESCVAALVLCVPHAAGAASSPGV